ncbi:type II secretion system protein [Bacillus sp. CH30_1T]|jgi:type IV pilus assembly protein PilA|uniref:pilin n=1 Tax=Bacillus sp. CH30_1T TaxID=2604836 RepID=UPI0011EC116E|nr:type II secretion system protein [Bacillus sp. CH30_1T]KAA0563639.1 type II secretion system protein [Bacillus sp. CH30_1T]
MLKKMKKMLKNDRGLTLVELLAVIVILGIIAAIAVPSIGNIIDNSKEDAQVAEALQIIGAAKLANASDSSVTTWDNSGLAEFLDNVEDESYSVSYSDGSYTLTGHDSAVIVKSTYTDETAVTEAELIEAAK